MLSVVALIENEQNLDIWQTEGGSLKDLPEFRSVHVAFDANSFFYWKETIIMSDGKDGITWVFGPKTVLSFQV